LIVKTIFMITITIFSCVASAVVGFLMGKKRGISIGYEDGYRNGRISCARNKRVVPTHFKNAEVTKSRKLEEDAVEWLG
jgi:hypothetical protein